MNENPSNRQLLICRLWTLILPFQHFGLERRTSRQDTNLRQRRNPDFLSVCHLLERLS